MTARPEASIVALSSVLNRIDKVKGVVPTVALTAAGSGLQTGKPIPTTAVAAVVEKSTDSTLEEGKDTPNELDADQKQAQVLHKALEDAVWYEFIDPTTSKAYYHCYATSETTWIKPSSFIAHNAYLGPSAGAADVSYKAYFNNANGRFSGQNYWEEVSNTLCMCFALWPSCFGPVTRDHRPLICSHPTAPTAVASALLPFPWSPPPLTFPTERSPTRPQCEAIG